MRCCLEFRTHNHGSFSSINSSNKLSDGLQTVPTTNFENGQIHHNLRINFGKTSRSSSRIFHPSRSSSLSFIHHAVLNQFFNHHGTHGVEIQKKKSNIDKMDSPIHAEYFHSGGANTMIVIVYGATAVVSPSAFKNPFGSGRAA